jgi:hypothetical protein
MSTRRPITRKDSVDIVENLDAALVSNWWPVTLSENIPFLRIATFEGMAKSILHKTQKSFSLSDTHTHTTDTHAHTHARTHT